MNAKSVLTLVLLAFVGVSVGYLVVHESLSSLTPAPGDGVEATNAPVAVAPTSAPQHRVVAYYFHNTQRCPTCLKIEEWSESALRGAFADEFADGALEWRVVNMEDSPNEHFVDDYELVTSSLVLVDFHEGGQRAWVNMDKVWELVHDDQAPFNTYVTDQVREYLDSQP